MRGAASHPIASSGTTTPPPPPPTEADTATATTDSSGDVTVAVKAVLHRYAARADDSTRAFAEALCNRTRAWDAVPARIMGNWSTSSVVDSVCDDHGALLRRVLPWAIAAGLLFLGCACCIACGCRRRCCGHIVGRARPRRVHEAGARAPRRLRRRRERMHDDDDEEEEEVDVVVDEAAFDPENSGRELTAMDRARQALDGASARQAMRAARRKTAPVVLRSWSQQDEIVDL